MGRLDLLFICYDRREAEKIGSWARQAGEEGSWPPLICYDRREAEKIGSWARQAGEEGSWPPLSN
ncbi:hypothetical protein EJB05_09203, partial [Eragrostis curvula]